jgi:hypothetical protein
MTTLIDILFPSAFGPRVSLPGGVDLLLIIFLEMPGMSNDLTLHELTPE